MIYEKILSEKQNLSKKLQTIKKQLTQLPSGDLCISKNGKHYKWYQKNGHTPIYIPKKRRSLAEQLAFKKYLLSLSKDFEHEITALNFYLRHHPNNYSQTQQILSHPEYQKLLTPFFKPISQELAEWTNASFDPNPNYPENKNIRASSGNNVRSKSEAFIDMILFTNKIPFRYECALQLGTSTIYPDFTIRHPQTGEFYYWEHFGKMDDPLYAKNTAFKLQLYFSHNIIPSINLITTYETSQHPLNFETLEKLVQHYFL